MLPPRRTARAALAAVAVLAVLLTAAAVGASSTSVTPHPSSVSGLSARSEQFPPLWVTHRHQGTGLRYRLADPAVSVELTDDLSRWFDEDAVVAGLTAFNDVPGSSFEVTVVDAGGDVLVDGAGECDRDGKDGGAAITYDIDPDEHRAVAWVTGARILLCGSLADRDAHYHEHAAAHEVGHLAGLGHLGGERCRGCAEAHRCAVMNYRLRECTRVTAGERSAVAALYPAQVDGSETEAPEPPRPTHGAAP